MFLLNVAIDGQGCRPICSSHWYSPATILCPFHLWSNQHLSPSSMWNCSALQILEWLVIERVLLLLLQGHPWGWISFCIVFKLEEWGRLKFFLNLSLRRPTCHDLLEYEGWSIFAPRSFWWILYGVIPWYCLVRWANLRN